MSKKCAPTLPEGQEDDRLDGEEFEHRLVRPEQVTGCKEEEEESVESQADGEVVDDGDVQVSSIYAARKQTNKQNDFSLDLSVSTFLIANRVTGSETCRPRASQDVSVHFH